MKAVTVSCKLLPPTCHLGKAVMYPGSINKLRKVHFMSNCINHIKNNKVQDPSTQSGGLNDLLN